MDVNRDESNSSAGNEPLPLSHLRCYLPVNHDRKLTQLSTLKPSHAVGKFRAGGLRVGTAVYRRVNLALFLAGFATFVSLYTVQPLRPEFSKSFGVLQALGSLPLSLTPGTLS